MTCSHLLFALAFVGSVACSKSSGNDIERLAHADPEVRVRAVHAVHRAKNAEAVDKLIELMNRDDSNDVRSAAALALGGIGDVRAASPLLEIVASDTDLALRARALNALGELRDPESLPHMIALWKLDGERDDNGVIHSGVKYTLNDMSDRSFGPLVDALRDDHPNVRNYAVHTLGLIGDARARSAISDLLDDPDPLVRIEAERALKELTER